MSAALRHLLEYVPVRTAVAVIRSLGPDRARRAAAGAANLFFALDKKHRERALGHLRESLPGLPAAARIETARSAFRSFALTLVEGMYIDRIVHPQTVRRVLDINLDPQARAVIERGRGAIFVTAHIGNWEMTGAAVALYGIRLISVARPIANPLIDRFVVSMRQGRGQRIVTKKGAVREMARTLRDGGYLGILVDQNAGRRGVFVPYFGKLASTTAAPATLALRFEIPIVPAWQHRVDGGRRHELFVEPPLPFPETGDRDRDVYELTAAMTARVEAWVRREPGQWLWAHRRWKSRPAVADPGRVRAGAEVVA